MIKLIHGDCREVIDLLKDGDVDAIVTDPPYGIGYAGTQSVGGTPGRLKAGWRTWKTTWDEQRLSRVEIQRLIEVSPRTVLWGGNFYANYLPPSGGWMVWDKKQRGLSFGDAELAWTNLFNAIRIFDLHRSSLLGDGKEHPTQKPVELMIWCLSFLPEECTIFDPYMGSGTTGIACLLTHRHFLGIERDAGYYAIAVERIEKMKAKMLSWHQRSIWE